MMVTRDRPRFAHRAVVYFQRQTYPELELVIVDDGSSPIDQGLPSDPRIHYIRLEDQRSIGVKRNIACELATGDIVATWDDDDWHGPTRLECQAESLLDGRADMTGFDPEVILDAVTWNAWKCDPKVYKEWCGSPFHNGTMSFWRRVWQEGTHYRDRSLAEDFYFRQDACNQGAVARSLPNRGRFIYVRHRNNTWRGLLGELARRGALEPLTAIPGLPHDDLLFYRSMATQDAVGSDVAAVPPGPPELEGCVENDTESSGPRARAPGPQTGRALERQRAEELVSCIMPTYDRRGFVPTALACFQRQDYPRRELIIVDDGSDPIEDLLPSDPRIHYIRLSERATVGAKRNIAIEHSEGSVIVHWDDDDWQAPNRLSYHVEALENHPEAELTGANRVLYLDSANGTSWLYQYPDLSARWVVGNSLGYRRSLWERSSFPDINIGEDYYLVSRARAVALLEDYHFMIALIHSNNVSPKRPEGDGYWLPAPRDEIISILGTDASLYGLVPESSAQCGTIPRIIHQIWLSDQIDDDYATLMATVPKLHPEWQYRLWRMDDLNRENFELFQKIQQIPTWAGKADLMRYEILYRHGGVYLDADMECVRSLDAVLRLPEVRAKGAFACNEDANQNDYCTQAALGARPGHPVFRTAVERALALHETSLQGRPNETTGPWFFRRCFSDDSQIHLLPTRTFYPYNWNQRPVDEIPEESVAIHRWLAGWR